MAIAIAALVVSAVALVAVYVAVRRTCTLQEQLDRAASDVQELRRVLDEDTEKLSAELADLQLALRQQAGETVFHPEMTIAAAMQLYPGVREVLASFQLDKCSTCEVSDVDTIQGACQTYGVNQTALMKALNGLVGSGSRPVTPATTTNVKVSF